MRLLGIFLSACVALAIVRVAVAALFLLFLIAIIWGLCLHPREMLGFLAYCAILGAVSAHPMLVITIVGVAIIVGHLWRDAQPGP